MRSSKRQIASLKVIPYGRQYIDAKDIAAVESVLRSEALTKGPRVDEFERALSKTVGASFAVAVNSGTSALHIACLAAGLRTGDEAITSTNTFVASANCIVYCGAKPVFADIDPRTFNVSPAQIEKKINERTKAIIPVHFAGQSAEMARIHEIVKKAEEQYGHKIFIIEDACHALGSRYKGKPVGSCAYSDMAVFSFHPVKHITTGEGGAVTTNDKKLALQLECLRSHGIKSTREEFLDNEQALSSSGSVNSWYYEQHFLGYNYRITDLQCALGISQLKKLSSFIRRRKEIVSQYNRAFTGQDFLTLPYELNDSQSNWHLYVLQIDFTKLKIERDAFMRKLKENRILSQVHYIPVHTQPYYRKHFQCQWGDYPNAEVYYKKCLSIPLFPMMSDGDIKKVITAVRGALNGK